MTGTDDGEEKEHEPTQKRLDDARSKGEIVRSTDLMAAAGYGGFLIAAVAVGAPALAEFGAAATILLDQADRLAPLFVAGESGLVAGAIGRTLVTSIPWFAVPLTCVIVVLLAQRGLVFAPEKLLPKLSRIDPIGNAKQKFGRSGLFEFAKSFLKLVLVSSVLGLFLTSRLPDILLSQHLSPAMGTGLLLRLITEFLSIVLVLALGIGALDYLFQRHEHLRKHRMSRKELTDEMKQSEGDPHVKQQRRQRGFDIAMNRMLKDVPDADVIIVNPTHYAVALRWHRGDSRAPICVAKGTDEIAARIREIAQENGVPIQTDPPTARALHATVNIGQEVRPEHYQAVAAAIRFAERMRKAARSQGWR